MTDKEKFRKEIERLKSNLIHGACSSQIAMETRCKEEAYNEVLAILDAMQEEPVSIWHDASKKSDNPEDVVIINPSDNTGEVLTKCTGVNQGHIWAYTSELLKLDNPCNIGKNLQEPQVKESAEIQHVNDMCKENGNSLTQEPVSEDLDEYINELSKQFPEVSFAKLSRIAVRVAKWKEQKMMAKAVDGYVIKDVEEGNGDFLLSADYLPKNMGLKDQQKVKVIVIKED